jgi:Tol biopolymer transport system component
MEKALLRGVAVLLALIGAAGAFSLLRNRDLQSRTTGSLIFQSNATTYNQLVLYQRGLIRSLSPESDISRNGAWSPDGSQIAFERQFLQPQTERYDIFDSPDIWVVDVASGNLRQITQHPSDDTNPIWSPDGSQLAFTSNRDSPESGGIRNLYVTDSRNPNPVRVTREGGTLVQPIWSPTGNAIVAGYNPGGGSGIDLYLIEMTPPLYPLTHLATPDNDFSWPQAWSPDGTKVAFTGDGNPNGGNSAHIYDLRTGQIIPLVQHLSVHTIAWSPDGSQIAISAYDPSGSAFTRNDIYLIDANQPEYPYRVLSQLPTNEISAVWSSDGSQLAYVVDTLASGRFSSHGNCEIYLLDITTELRHRLRTLPTGLCDRRPQWQPAAR